MRRRILAKTILVKYITAIIPIFVRKNLFLLLETSFNSFPSYIDDAVFDTT